MSERHFNSSMETLTHKPHAIPCFRLAAKSLVISVWCLLWLPAYAAKSSQPDKAAIAGVEDTLRKNDWSEAIELSRAALKTDPRDYRMWTLQGMAYAGSGQATLALLAYDHALKLQVNYLPALEGAAQVSYQQGGKSSRLLLERVLRLRPQDPTTHAMLATLAYKDGDCVTAILHFSQAQAVVMSTPSALFQYGICLAKQSRLDEAITVLQQANLLEPGNDIAAYNLALLLWKQKHYDDAYKALQPSIVSDTKSEEVLTLAADIDEERNDTSHAVEMLRRAILGNPSDPRAYLWFATLASNHTSYQVGIDMLNAGLLRLPQEGQLRLARGVLYAQMGEFDRATEDFEAANRLDPHLSFTGTAEGIIATQKHDLETGIKRFREQVRQHPNNAYAHYLLAESLRQQGTPVGSPEYVEALDAATHAVELDPNLTLAHAILAVLYLNAGNTAQSVAHCEAVLRSHPDDQEALYHLILALRKSDRRDEIPALTKRLVAARSAENDRELHTMRYQLVDNVVRSSVQAGQRGANPPK